MTRFSQFAAPAIIGAALFVGAAGCANHEPPIPARAQLLGEGRETATATAMNDGTAYIYDDTSNDIIYTGKVEKGDMVKVDAKHNRVLLNDRVAMEKDLTNDHKYLIYIDPKLPEAGTAVHREGETVIKNESGTTVITPAPSGGNATVVQPAVPPPPSNDTTVVQPDGTVVKPGSSGTTVITPSR